MQWLSLLIPIAYLGILIGSMATFSHLYRQRQHTSKLRLAPYFPPHTTRNIYLSLLHLQDDPATKVPDTILRAALLNRAIADIERFMEVKTRKPALATLLQRGVVGDEIFQRLTRAEQEMEIEVKDVMAEANALASGWGQYIFQSANEIVHNRQLKEKIDAVKGKLEASKLEWEVTREKARLELEGIDSGVVATPAAPVRSAPAPAPASQTVETPQQDKVSKAGSSDEDGVIVDTPPTDSSPASAAGGGAKKNKKKNKK
ncbi:hypothetical protein PV10_07561 [Exophiala mesophila]|uniref:Translocation protein sec66 n=1 Tax=Exophiala mesophila TaxID=212818 RepID=A0A0D1Z5W7_EXOME|nr:uncharacterized protein PV10_07561 [Exophiala mesophila]KIV90232.1 hypothetical protein PV10_07561 [Exophiala mesophila]